MNMTSETRLNQNHFQQRVRVPLCNRVRTAFGTAIVVEGMRDITGMREGEAQVDDLRSAVWSRINASATCRELEEMFDG